MNPNDILNRIKNHKDSHKMGMIASHLGIVRETSRSGKYVEAVNVVFDKKVIDEIIQEIKSMKGIVEVIIEVNEGHLNVGDDVMFVAVGGDIRDNVFPALERTVDLMKKRAGNKKEIYKE